MHQRQYHPPSCTGAAVFGNFSGAKGSGTPQLDPRAPNSGIQPSVQIPGEDFAGKEVESSPASNCGGRGVNVEMVGADGHSSIERQERGKTTIGTYNGRDVASLGFEGTDTLAMNLVNVPLQFTAQSQYSAQPRVVRGRGKGRGIRGRPSKWTRGVQLFEDDMALVHGAKRRLNLIDYNSNSIGGDCSAVPPQFPPDAMKILNWNCQGIGPLGQFGPYQSLLSSTGLVFLSETKCKARRVDGIKNLVSYNSIRVDSVRKGGGFFLLWRKDLDVWLQSFSVHHIDATVLSDSYPARWHFTGFYRYPEVANSKEGWNLIRRLPQSSTHPWVCVGDFNEILAQNEKQGSLPRALWQINDFREYLRDCGLQDMGYEGDIFTWCNRRAEPHTFRARLDRACCDMKWADLFLKVRVFHEPIACSDHSAIWLSLDGNTRLSLLQWNKDCFGNIQRQSRDLGDTLNKILATSITTEMKAEVEKIRDVLESLAVNEEIMVRKEIKKLTDSKGREINDKKGIQGIILDYFGAMFKSTRPTDEALSLVLGCLDNRVTPAVNGTFLQSFTSEEVTLALKQMHPMKSPGPDGKKGYVSLKLDVSKAYDRVEWRFLESVLLRLGFHRHFVSLIMTCVSSVSFSFLLNGEQFGFLCPERGLRQGDPLSPYLFLLCAEVLSGMLCRAEHMGLIQGVAVSRSAPRVSHLLFVDDTLIFCSATTEAMTCIQQILLDFERALGLKINSHKSAIVFSRNVEENRRLELAGILGVMVVPRHDKYLGLP
ncbi:UNVERIFIED_CONTAM: putative mitochondrial protein [Sesamum latifolium]|uniref:Mitochondrial protein n=1 Tax=Sesamum latifolium TaxID=2727402 RepID=A0AAW2X1G7_9LAMI